MLNSLKERYCGEALEDPDPAVIKKLAGQEQLGDPEELEPSERDVDAHEDTRPKDLQLKPESYKSRLENLQERCGKVHKLRIKEDMVDEIMAYESGKLSDKEVIKLFQKLLDSGQVWHLQGAYGRMAKRLIDAGLIKKK